MKTLSIGIALTAFSLHFAQCQDTSVVSGMLPDFEFSKISIQGDEDPFTGAQDNFDAVILDSGRFLVQAELYGPNIFLLEIDDNPIIPFFLCPGEDLTITADSGGLKFNGSTRDYQSWSQVLRDDYLHKYTLAFAENAGKNTKHIDSLVSYLFELREQNVSGLDRLVDKFDLSECEQLFCKNEISYAIYTYLWSDLIQRGYPINDEVFRFMSRLNLDDSEAAKISISYNRALEVFLFLNLRLEHGWYDPRSFDPTSESFDNLFYEKILIAIQNDDVRNGLLTRKVISLLSTGSTSAERLFKRYLDDCTDSFYRKVAFKYYNDYLKEKRLSDQEMRIEQLKGSLFKRLSQHKEKILYLDFWASWCGPCIQSIPFTVKLQEQYRNHGVEVIFIAIDDNIGSVESAAKRLGLKENLIFLDRKQSDEVRKTFQMRGIPHYVLVDKNGIIVDSDAPQPNSGAIETRLNELLGK